MIRLSTAIPVLFLVSIPGTATLAADPTGVAKSTALVVTQSFPPVVPLGKSFTAAVTVSNPMPVAVQEVYLIGDWSPSHTLGQTNPPPARKEGRVTWLLGQLEANETRTVTLEFLPASEGPSLTEFRSEFDVSYRTGRRYVQTTPVAKAQLGITITAPEVAVVGQPLTLMLDLKNSGSSDAQGIRLRSTMPEALVHPKGPEVEAEIGVIQAGRTEVIPLVVTPTRAGAVKAVIRMSGADQTEVEAEVNFQAVEAKIGLAIHGPRELPRGWPGTYEVTVKNEGQQPAAGVRVEIPIPEGFTDLRATPGAKLDPTAKKLIWMIGDLPPSQERQLIWLGVASASGDPEAKATVFFGETPIQSAVWSTRVSERLNQQP